MKKISKISISILVFLMLFSICACNSTDETTITSSIGAINAAKNKGKINNAAEQIACDLGFSYYEDPYYHSSSATQNEDKSWTVTLKGDITGYKDNLRTQKEQYQFAYTLTVTEEGFVQPDGKFISKQKIK